jgi:prepilin-type N-terminal cleavage/methylation domain-containing protein
MRNRKGFTLVEVLIAVAIFSIIMGLVLAAVSGMFRAVRQAQVSIEREQRSRFFLGRLSKEISSFTRIEYPRMRFKGDKGGFGFIYAREDALVKSRFACTTGALEHYWQEPADYDWNAYQGKEIGLSNLTACGFSYSDGSAWHDTWEDTNPQFPSAVKIRFMFSGDDKQRELIINIPVNQ